MKQVLFHSTKEDGAFVLLTLYPDIPELRVTSEGVCILTGEDVGKLTAWLTTPGYELPR